MKYAKTCFEILRDTAFCLRMAEQATNEDRKTAEILIITNAIMYKVK